MNYDVIIIGAGASGLIAAITAARNASTVLIIEHKEKAGKKILATGNGKCNFTNTYQQPDCYRSNDSAFVTKVLSCFDVTKTIEFFGELGIAPKNKNGYLYPYSEQSQSMVTVLLMECRRLGINIVYQEHVTQISTPRYTVITKHTTLMTQKKYSATHLILAAGGCASPNLGSDGSGYELAKEFGHTVIKPLPALVQLKSPEKFCRVLSGVRIPATVTLFSRKDNQQRRRDGKAQFLVKETGEILFTDYGISGIPILQISRFAAKALEQGNEVLLSLDFYQEISPVELTGLLKQRRANSRDKSTEEMMIGLLPHKLSYILLKNAKLAMENPARSLTDQELDNLAEQIKFFTMRIHDTNSFENAQVSAGGVSLKEIYPDTMESKLRSKLYFAGELVDVDGTCGGYNLQWAWSSGYLAGHAASLK